MEQNLITPAMLSQFSDPDEPVLFTSSAKKRSAFNIGPSRVLILTHQRIYLFENQKIARKHKITHCTAFIRSSKSQEILLIIPELKNLHLDNVNNIQDFQSMLQMRFANMNSQKTLKIFCVPEKSLAPFRAKNRYGFSNLPHDQCRMTSEEIQGSDDIQQVAKPEESMDFSSNRFSMVLQEEDSSKVDGLMANDMESFKQDTRSSILLKSRNDVQVTLDDFDLKVQLGRGTFGKVYLAELKSTKVLYAMKVIRKDVLIEYDQIESTQLEKDILFAADHPFLVGMEFLFQTETRLYFVMPFVKGGELYKVFQSQKRFPESVVKFYAVQIVLAVGELHSKGIMHRDLKLENILVDDKGYLKIIDYGLAKMISGNQLAQSYCGTPEYIAPEMVTGKGHDYSVDWWALGVLMYEMLIGVTPFFNSNRKVLESKIRNSKVVFPDRQQYRVDYSDELQDVILQLLQKDRTVRLGSHGGMHEILQHPFFKGVEPRSYETYQVTPPFKPKLDQDNLTKFFNADSDQFALQDTYLPMAKLEQVKKHQNAFAGFSNTKHTK